MIILEKITILSFIIEIILNKVVKSQKEYLP